MPKKGGEDPAMDKVRSIFKESGLSLVELGKRMGYADDTARQAAWQFMQSGDPRMSMLRKFAIATGVSLEELGHKGKRMTRKLNEELEECGCGIDPGQFRELLEDRKAATSPSWTVDDLVCHPDEASKFCDLIRSETKCQRLSDYLILRTLMNIRRSH
jgi:transcriptional regulator with XRE-family HTH domain